jgi:hypothetical protein
MHSRQTVIGYMEDTSRFSLIISHGGICLKLKTLPADWPDGSYYYRNSISPSSIEKEKTIPTQIEFLGYQKSKQSI